MASVTTGEALYQPEDPPSPAPYITGPTLSLPEEATSEYEDDDGVFGVSKLSFIFRVSKLTRSRSGLPRRLCA